MLKGLSRLRVNVQVMNSYSVDQLEEHLNCYSGNYMTIIFEKINIHEIARDKLEVLFKYLSKIEYISELFIVRVDIDKIESDIIKMLIDSVKGRIIKLQILEDEEITTDTISLNRKMIYLDLIKPKLESYLLVNTKVGFDLKLERELIKALTKAPIDDLYLYNNNLGSHKELTSVYIDLFSSEKKTINLSRNNFGSGLSEEDFIEMLVAIKQNNDLIEIEFGDNNMQLILNEKSSSKTISFITSTSQWLDKISLSDNFEESIKKKITISKEGK